MMARRGAFAAASRRAAWVAFVVVIVLSPFRARMLLATRRTPAVYGDYTNFLLFWSDLAVAALVVLWLVSVALAPRRIVVGPWFVAAPVALVLGSAWLSVPFAVDIPLAAYNAIRLMMLVVVGLYVVNELGRIRRIVVPASLMVAVQAIVGITQVVGQRSVGLRRLGEYVLSPRLGVSVITADNGTRYLRAYGLTDHPNILGGLLALALLLIGGVLATEGRRVAPWAVAVLAAGAVALLLTFSRGAWISLVVGLVVTVAMLTAAHDRIALRRLGVTCAAGALVMVPFVIPYRSAFGARTDTSGRSATEVRSVNERTTLWDATTDIVRDHPTVGVGLGVLPLAMRDAEPHFAYSYQPASVVLLDVTAETGVLGGVAYLALLVAPWVALLRRRLQWTPELAVASGALAALTVIGLFDYYTWTYSSGRIWAWLVLGLWVVAYRNAVRGAPDAV
jgi:O-antigen ligase